MMLCYKIWCETRTRFVMSLVALAAICTIILVFQHHSRSLSPMSYSAYVWNAIYKDYVRNLFVMMAIVLGGGSLLQEREHGTAGFTLALPVSRFRILSVRAAVGISEVLLLALAPAVLIPGLARLTGETYAASQALAFVPLWTCCGVMIFGLSQLLANLIKGPAAAWFCSFLALMLYAAAVNVTPLSRFPYLDCFHIMSGAGLPYFDANAFAIAGPLPWLPLLCFAAVGACFLAAAACITHARDFA